MMYFDVPSSKMQETLPTVHFLSHLCVHVSSGFLMSTPSKATRSSSTPSRHYVWTAFPLGSLVPRVLPRFLPRVDYPTLPGDQHPPQRKQH